MLIILDCILNMVGLYSHYIVIAFCLFEHFCDVMQFNQKLYCTACLLYARFGPFKHENSDATTL